MPAEVKRNFPKPLGPDDLDYVIEVLRNEGDCDDRAELAAQVELILITYDKLFYEQ